MVKCPRVDQLEALLAERLTRPRADEIGSHVGTCAVCQLELERLTSATWNGREPAAAARGGRDGALERLLDRMRDTPPDASRSTDLGDGRVEHESVAFPGRGSADAPLGRLGPYDLLAELGGGATGIVYRARDTKLGRLVAVKVLRGELSSVATARARFEREARAAAAIPHDHIVTVFDVEAPAEWPPYLVMECVEGESLADRLRRVGSIEPAESARIAGQVAAGLAAAHGRGLIHRDIKPSNILIDSTGRAQITDFGLARMLDAASGLTQEGTVAGTPAYMSPEQLTSPHDLDGRCDVYALGVVLYEMITGEVPFSGATRMILLQVLHDDPRPPRRLNDRIPADLETICLKAMAKDPQRRYGTAAELADDLDRWLGGTPIRARPVSAAERTWRWCRRNPYVAALGGAVAALLATVAVGSFFFAVQLSLERSTAQSNARLASQQRDLALGTIKQLVFEVQRELEDRPGMLRLREQMLDGAVESLRRLAAHSDVHAASPAGTSDLHLQLGGIFLRLGRLEDARQQFEQLRGLCERALREGERAPGVQRNLAAAFEKLGDVHDRLGRTSAAVEYYVQGVTVLEEVVARHGDLPDARLALATLHSTLGSLQLEVGAEEAAREHFERSQSLLGELASTQSDDWRLRHELAAAYGMLGCLNLDVGDVTATQDCVRRFREAVEAAAATPHDARSRRELIVPYLGIGDACLGLNDIHTAHEYFHKAITLADALVTHSPDDTELKRHLAAALEGHATSSRELNELDTATTNLSRALQINRQLAERDDRGAESQRNLANTHELMANLCIDREELDTALEHFHRALTLDEALAKADPDSARARRNVARTHHRIGQLYLERGDTTTAARHAAQAIELAEPLLQSSLDASEARRNLIDYLHGSATIHLAVGDAQAARRHTERGLVIATDWTAADPDNVDAQLVLVTQFERLAQATGRMGDESAGQGLCRKAVEAIDRLDAAGKLTGPLGFDLLFARSTVLARMGHHDEALATMERMRRQMPVGKIDLYNLACCYARCAAAGQDRAVTAESSAAELTARDAYAAAALRLLQESVANGFIDYCFMRRDPDLKSLRDRSDFQELLAKLRDGE